MILMKFQRENEPIAITLTLLTYVDTLIILIRSYIPTIFAFAYLYFDVNPLTFEKFKDKKLFVTTTSLKILAFRWISSDVLMLFLLITTRFHDIFRVPFVF